jgi:hypothetical protein
MLMVKAESEHGGQIRDGSKRYLRASLRNVLNKTPHAGSSCETDYSVDEQWPTRHFTTLRTLEVMHPET